MRQQGRWHPELSTSHPVASTYNTAVTQHAKTHTRAWDNSTVGISASHPFTNTWLVLCWNLALACHRKEGKCTGQAAAFPQGSTCAVMMLIYSQERTASQTGNVAGGSPSELSSCFLLIGTHPQPGWFESGRRRVEDWAPQCISHLSPSTRSSSLSIMPHWWTLWLKSFWMAIYLRHTQSLRRMFPEVL